jgi:trk system potassium uptake protein TrkH
MSYKYKIINIKAVLYIWGIMLVICGSFMLFGIPFSLYYGSDDIWALLASSSVTVFTGSLLFFSNNSAGNKNIGKREAFLIVGLSYFIMGFFGSLPYLFSGAIPNFSNAYFETVSGLTTTGASVLTDIEAVQHGILFWRSMTQWMGGMGIILLTIAILPYFGIGQSDLFVAEVPGPTKEKLHPRINETAKRLWFIYVGLTAILTIVLFMEGMSFFDAINHSMATLSTGGFSTKNASVAHFNSPLIEYTITIFMILAGINFTLHYFALKKRFREILTNEEFKLYIYFIFGITLFISAGIILFTLAPLEATFRGVFFSVASIITTTGFVNVDYTKWMDWVTMLFFWLLFTGGMAGSTAGGIKVIRHLIMVRNSIYEFKRMLHPRAIVPVRFNNTIIPEPMIYNVLAFFIIYVVIFIISSLILAGISTVNMDLMTALSATATCLGNVGPGVGNVGPVNNFFDISASGKWLLSFLMVIGRLELFTVLVLFTPYFWKKM